MKKSLTSLLLLASTLTLVACSQTTQSTTANNTKTVYVEKDDDDQLAQATLIITSGDNRSEQEVTFEVGDSVMDVLEDNAQAEEEDGMVTAINGVSQDPSQNTYWMYKVNDTMAEVGAENYDVKAGDKIEFYLEKF